MEARYEHQQLQVNQSSSSASFEIQHNVSTSSDTRYTMPISSVVLDNSAFRANFTTHPSFAQLKSQIDSTNSLIQEKRAARNAKAREKMREYRARRSEKQVMADRKRNAEQKRIQRQQRSQEQLLYERQKNAEMKRACRARRNEEQALLDKPTETGMLYEPWETDYEQRNISNQNFKKFPIHNKADSTKAQILTDRPQETSMLDAFDTKIPGRLTRKFANLPMRKSWKRKSTDAVLEALMTNQTHSSKSDDEALPTPEIAPTVSVVPPPAHNIIVASVGEQYTLKNSNLYDPAAALFSV